MKIGIGADHRGFDLKKEILEYLQNQGYKVIDYGANSLAAVDYPNIALRLACDVALKKLEYGILLCYTGQGMAMTANKVKGIRAAICTSVDIAELTRKHNDANILVFPAGFVKFGKPITEIIEKFLTTEFEGGRHARRLNIIKDYEDSPDCI